MPVSAMKAVTYPRAVARPTTFDTSRYSRWTLWSRYQWTPESLPSTAGEISG